MNSTAKSIKSYCYTLNGFEFLSRACCLALFDFHGFGCVHVPSDFQHLSKLHTTFRWCAGNDVLPVWCYASDHKMSAAQIYSFLFEALLQRHCSYSLCCALDTMKLFRPFSITSKYYSPQIFTTTAKIYGILRNEWNSTLAHIRSPMIKLFMLLCYELQTKFLWYRETKEKQNSHIYGKMFGIVCYAGPRHCWSHIDRRRDGQDEDI